VRNKYSSKDQHRKLTVRLRLAYEATIRAGLASEDERW
jgi:hypothetical protein